jgi:hypothetical protein
MKFGGGGLKHVSTSDLRAVLSRVHDGSLECPITHPRILRAGLPKLIDDLGHLNGLDARAVQAVIVAVLAERTSEPKRA